MVGGYYMSNDSEHISSTHSLLSCILMSPKAWALDTYSTVHNQQFVYLRLL